MPSVSEVQAEIEQRLRMHTEALARGDTDTALQLFGSGATVRPPGVAPLRGPTALREYFERAFASMNIVHGTFFTEELYLYDSLAFHFGTYEFTALTPAGGEKGGFAIVWRRQRDGSWRYHRGLLNSSRPRMKDEA